MKMLYYISENIEKEGMSFANHLIKRCDTYQEAVEYLKEKVREWSEVFYKAMTMDVEGDVWGAQALDDDFMVIHMYHIFATPMFMAGGEEGL